MNEKCGFGDIIKEQVDKIETRIEADVQKCFDLVGAARQEIARLKTEELTKLRVDMNKRPPIWASTIITLLSTYAVGITMAYIQKVG